MPIKLGSTNFGDIYLGSTKIGEAYLGSVKVYGSRVDPYNPLNLPPNTIRCKFYKNSDSRPTMGDTQTLVDAEEYIWDIYKSGTDWSYLFSNSMFLLSVIGANSTGVTDMSYMFNNCTTFKSVALFDTSAVTNMAYMFYWDGITSVPFFDTHAVTNMSHTFAACDKLTSVPLFDTSAVTNMYSTFQDCSSLTALPLFDTRSVTDMYKTFYNCYKVESGALALYRQASTQATPPTYYTECFKYCGRDTVTGAADLSQIPASWGGTGS